MRPAMRGPLARKEQDGFNPKAAQEVRPADPSRRPGSFLPALAVMLLLFVAGGCRTTGTEAPQAPAAGAPAVAKGKLAAVSAKAGTVSLKTKSGIEIFRFDDATELVDAASIRSFRKNETVKILYRSDDPARTALRIERVLARLPEGVPEMKPDELAALMESAPAEEWFLVDARPPRRYAMSHIPGAVSIPLAVLKEKGASVLPGRKDTLLVFYCGGYTCGLSPKCAAIAKKLGYTNVKGMLAGEPGWKKAGHVTVSTQDYAASGNVVLVDLRSPEEAAAGHLPGAVNIPFASLEDAEDDFPEEMGAPIIFYGRGDEPAQAVRTARSWGYMNATVLEEGYAGWLRAGRSIETGPAAAEIVYVRKPLPGEVGIEDFRAAVASRPADTAILDVRSAEERAAGRIEGSIHIPLDELPDRISELSPDRLYLVHCNTGVRAEMAHHLLKKKGIRSRFLLATVEFEDGVLEISP